VGDKRTPAMSRKIRTGIVLYLISLRGQLPPNLGMFPLYTTINPLIIKPIFLIGINGVFLTSYYRSHYKGESGKGGPRASHFRV